MTDTHIYIHIYTNTCKVSNVHAEYPRLSAGPGRRRAGPSPPRGISAMSCISCIYIYIYITKRKHWGDLEISDFFLGFF